MSQFRCFIGRPRPVRPVRGVSPALRVLRLPGPQRRVRHQAARGSQRPGAAGSAAGLLHHPVTAVVKARAYCNDVLTLVSCAVSPFR